jgi:proteasome lid subunit RPN8/RPN11
MDIGRHASRDGHDSRFGFILGRLFRCPESGVHYTVADECIRADEPLSEEAPDPFLLRAWADSQPAFRAHEGVLVGWYHTHYLLGLFLSEGDRETNTRYFNEPWQCSVLVVPDEARPMGAVFRPSAAEAGSGGAPSPFRELLAPEDVPAGGAIPSAVGWTNYLPDRSVTRISDPEFDGHRDSETPSVVPFPPEADPASSVTLVLPDNRAESLYSRLSVHRRVVQVLFSSSSGAGAREDVAPPTSRGAAFPGCLDRAAGGHAGLR